jgi:hypothetical protein
MGIRPALLVGAAGIVLAALAIGPLAGTGSAERLRAQELSIDPIRAVFSDPDRATTYSVAVHETEGSATVSYSWTLTLEAVDPNVNVDGLTFDAECDNHGVLSGTASTFVWHHGNKGDPLHDDDCNHDLQGKYGHQGLISLTVNDSAGWRCNATYKGTLSSDAAKAAGIDAQGTPTCTPPTSSPPPPPPPPPPPKPCKCLTLTARIVPRGRPRGAEAASPSGSHRRFEWGTRRRPFTSTKARAPSNAGGTAAATRSRMAHTRSSS